MSEKGATDMRGASTGKREEGRIEVFAENIRFAVCLAASAFVSAAGIAFLFRTVGCADPFNIAVAALVAIVLSVTSTVLVKHVVLPQIDKWGSR